MGSILVDPRRWTGGLGGSVGDQINSSMLEPYQRQLELAAAKAMNSPGGEIYQAPPPEPVASEPPPRPVAALPADIMAEAEIAEYQEVAMAVGFVPPDLTIQRFKLFLTKHDLPVFDLPSVIAYMDDKAAKDSGGRFGWEWRPLRPTDRPATQFGDRQYHGMYGPAKKASDYYAGGEPIAPYDKPVPLEALRKVALIEREFGPGIAFMVSDYAVLRPDPFLMAVIVHPNNRLGVGRFVIDFWDEPGFGVATMVR